MMDVGGLQDLANRLMMLSNLEQKVQDVVAKLADMGVNIATQLYQTSIYAGANDTHVRRERVDTATFEVIAEGQSVMFIEFGTGILNPDDHPEKPAGLSPHGQYGMGKASDPRGWVYYGVTGNAPDTRYIRPGVVKTKGNVANKSLYNARKELETKVIDVVKEVFT